MKAKIAIAPFILFCQTAFAQTSLIGQYEHKYFTDEGFGQIFKIEFLQNDSFRLNMFHEQICYDRTVNISGLFKVKKDTLVFITPLSKNLFTTFEDKTILNNQIVYSINKFKYYSDLSPYLFLLNFYFLDSGFNLIMTKPIDTKKIVDTSFKHEIKYDEVSFKFNVPSNALYFIARPKYGESTTFNIQDVRGKLFTDKIRSKEEHFDDQAEGYIDLSFEKYLLNKKRTTFTSVEQKHGPTGYLIKIQYDKK